MAKVSPRETGACAAQLTPAPQRAGLVQGLMDRLVRRLRPGWVRRTAAPLLDGYENFAPIARMDLPQGTRLAVIAPHPDDESIGAGGLMALWADAARQCEVTFLTRGEAGNPALRADLPDDQAQALRQATATTRRTEAEEAVKLLGATALFHDGTDGALWRDEDRLTAELALRWTAQPPDVIAAPDPADRHIDHAAAARITARAAQAAGLDGHTTVLGYEVWSPCRANTALPIAGVAARKAAAIALHGSQVATTDYVAAATALNLYRGVTAGFGPHPAEAFHRQTLTAYAAQTQALKV